MSYKRKLKYAVQCALLFGMNLFGFWNTYSIIFNWIGVPVTALTAFTILMLSGASCAGLFAWIWRN